MRLASPSLSRAAAAGARASGSLPLVRGAAAAVAEAAALEGYLQSPGRQPHRQGSEPPLRNHQASLPAAVLVSLVAAHLGLPSVRIRLSVFQSRQVEFAPSLAPGAANWCATGWAPRCWCCAARKTRAHDASSTPIRPSTMRREHNVPSRRRPLAPDFINAIKISCQYSRLLMKEVLEGARLASQTNV